MTEKKKIDQMPNILWICSDQQRFDTLGCYGNPYVSTPNLDRLADNGALFVNAFSQNPVCTPSRASFLTGRYPRTTRCRQNGQDIPKDEILLTKLLSDAGYVCGLSGKLHISACNPESGRPSERRIDDGYHVFNWSHDTADLWPMNEYYAWLRELGEDYRTTSYAGSLYVKEGMPTDLHQTTWCVNKAISFIENSARHSMPWLFSVNMFDPHHPFDPPLELLKRYLTLVNEIPLPNYVHGELDGKPKYQRYDSRGAYGHQGAYSNAENFSFDEMTDNDHRLVKAAYWAMCDLIDFQVGRLLGSLRESGQEENTIVIFMSDHGEMLGDHGIYLKGPYFYEPAVRVPLIINNRKLVVPRRIDALVELVDIAQTILDFVGLPHYEGMQGKSLFSLLTNPDYEDEHRQSVYSEYYNAMPWHKDPTAQATMVRTKTHKLVVQHSTKEGELYDLIVDSDESNNLWASPEHRDIKIELLTMLCDRMAWTVDPLPLRIAKW